MKSVTGARSWYACRPRNRVWGGFGLSCRKVSWKGQGQQVNRVKTAATCSRSAEVTVVNGKRKTVGRDGK